MNRNIFNNDIVKATKVKPNRSDKISKEIKVILSDIFAKSKLKDPFLFDKTVLVSDVNVSGDLSLAKVYVISWNVNLDKDTLIVTLNKYIPFFRKQITKALKIKVIPKLIFIMDDQFDKMDQAKEMFKLLEKDSK